jgi:large subunit ribosomal protein L43
MLRGQLRSFPANGYAAFLPQIRKLVFEVCEKWPSSANTRTYLRNTLQPLARDNPHVEIVVKQRNHKEPIVRGFYGLQSPLHTPLWHSLASLVNNRDKVIPLNGLEVTAIHKKVELLLDSSGAKIKSLKRRNVESTTEAARGIWSGLHAQRPTL